MIINNAEFDDLISILELQKLCYKENAERINDYTILPLTQTIKDIEDEFNYKVILKAEDQSEIIGSVRAYEEAGICYIGKLIVNPNCQNKGIGTKLMNEIEKRFPDASKYELFTGDKDEKNIYFYGKLGYKIFEEKEISDKLKLIFLEKDNI